MKIFLDGGKPSQNFHLQQWSFQGQGSDANFFRNSQANMFEDPSSPAEKFLDKAFNGIVTLLLAENGNPLNTHPPPPEKTNVLSLYE